MLAWSYLLLQNSVVQSFIIQKITERLSIKTNAKISVGKVDFVFFNRIAFDDVLIAGPENDTIFYAAHVLAKIDSLKLRKHILSIGELSFEKNLIFISQDPANRFNFSFILDSLRTGRKDTTINWNIKCNNFSFRNSKIAYSNMEPGNNRLFDIKEMGLEVEDFLNYADSTAFKVKNLTLNYNNYIQVHQLSANVNLTKTKIEVGSLNLISGKSEFRDLQVRLQVGIDETGFNRNSDIEIQFYKSTVNLSELAELVPLFNQIDENVEVSGRIFGNLNDLKGREITLKTGQSTNAMFDFYANGIDNPETMYLFLDLKQFETTVNDLGNFYVVKEGKKVKLQIHESLYNSGLLSFKGSFSGFLSDFVTYGTLKSRMGIIKTDVSVIPKKNGVYSFNGRINTTDFNLGNLLNSKNIGKISFNGNTNGDFQMTDKSISGLFKGEIAKLEARNYVYKNVKLDGLFKNKLFDGMVSMNDSNLRFNFEGKWNASAETPDYDFILDVDKFIPGNLNLGNNLNQAEMAFNMKAKFTGNKLDNLKGVIVVDDGYFKNSWGSFSLNGIKLISVPQDSKMELTFNSNYFDVYINGNYQFQDIWYSLKNNINQFIPAFNFQSPKNLKQNLFDYRITVKNLDDIAHVFAPGLNVETPFFLYGKMDTKNSNFELEGSIPGFQYKNLWFRNIFISNKTSDKQYASKFRFSELAHKNGLSIHNLSINSEIENNVIHNKIGWFAKTDSTRYSSVSSYTYFSPSGSSKYPKINIDFLPSAIYLTDTVWQLDGFTANIDSTTVKINNFNLYNQKQAIEAGGIISKDSTEKITAHVKNIDLKFMQKNLPDEKLVEGILNFSVSVSQLYRQPVILADANISNLYLKNQLVGDVYLNSTWDQVESEIVSTLEIVNLNKRSLFVNGAYKPETKALNYLVKADSLPLKLLETVIIDNFSDFAGTTTGEVKITGKPDKIYMNGSAKVNKGALTIDYIQSRYFIDDLVYFNGDSIQFKNLTFTDSYGNRGRLNGVLAHDNFNNMLYDLTVASPKIQVMNTNARNNEQFYGEIIGNGRITIQGQGLKVRLGGSLTTLPGTSVNISMEYENIIQQYDFLEFVNTRDISGKSMLFYDPPKTDFTIALNVEVTPDAKTQLVYNSHIGDEIKAVGEGILLFEMNKYGDISLSGDYTVIRGDYLFTLQSIVNKRFTIAPGGTIVWSGDPYNAIINLTAIYSLKTSLSDLLGNSNNNMNYLYQRIPVDCVIDLTDELINPTIKFKINFPDENEGVKNELQQFINTEEEINKQILSLIVLGKFYTPEYIRGQYETQNPNMIGATASELFSNQLSNWLSQISKNVNVGFKYRPGNAITNDELELALSTQIFNDRVILNGNIGNNVNPESNNSSQIVGDFDMHVKLTPNGKIQFKVYNHSNNDLIFETAPYTQGIGFSFKEEYNSLNDLFQKIVSIFKRKDNRAIKP